MHRFFIPPESFTGEWIEFPVECARQIGRVLRLKPGDQVIVLDGSGREALVELTAVGRQTARGKMQQVRRNACEPAIHLTLGLGLTQREKFEWTLQKATEAGASAFVPLITRRGLVQNHAQLEEKYSRWRRILKEAAEQSGRGILPALLPVQTFQVFIQQRSSYASGWLAWEGETSRRLWDAARTISPGSRAAVLIGAEGGWDGEEVRQAVQADWQPVSLGRRTLRTETAAVVATALLLAQFETEI
jgi:16S rRNA (uracil1498-N3)-methyltransferase